MPTNSFEGFWGAGATQKLDAPSNAFRFQDSYNEPEELYLEVGDVSTIWNYFNDFTGGVSTEVTWSGAAQLTAAAGAVAVALLF